MSKWTIAKQIDFCYGHRVFSQVLNAEYSIDNACKCRHIHGHQGTIHVHLTADNLTEGMVTDFKHLNWFKKFVDDVLDHKFILGREDPMFDMFIPPDASGAKPPIKWFPEGHGIVDPNYFKMISDSALIEILEGYVVVEFVPTSENLSKWLFEIVDKKMSKIGVKTESIQFFETPKSQSHYFGDSTVTAEHSDVSN